MSGDCHNLVTTLFLVNKLITIFSQGCYKIVVMSESCYNTVPCKYLVTRLLQLCNFYMGMILKYYYKIYLLMIRLSDW